MENESTGCFGNLLSTRFEIGIISNVIMTHILIAKLSPALVSAQAVLSLFLLDPATHPWNFIFVLQLYLWYDRSVEQSRQLQQKLASN